MRSPFFNGRPRARLHSIPADSESAGKMKTPENQDMGPVYAALRDEARRIADGFPTADFYRVHNAAIERSREVLQGHALLADIFIMVRRNIENDFGHGLTHARKVALDAGALMLIECERSGIPSAAAERNLLLVQAAGLLHDMRRKERHHAKAGAAFARKALTAFNLTSQEIDFVCYAIRNHEAFQRIQPPPTPEAALMSDCLYDADKFRWGPDNFTDTLWDMVTFYNPPLSVFVERYPGGMRKLEEIKATFRSETGKRYGPQIIDFGVRIGRELMNVIRTEFTHLI